MFPVFKSGDRRNIRNYRGITNLSAASKLFEIIVSQALLSRTKSYICTDQHGFMPNRSVTTNLLHFTSTCIRQMEDKAQVDVIYTDLKAAFDRIDHRILLHKISRLGASQQLTSWLRSYLSNRALQVQFGDSLSSPFSNNSGVPQGSNLGPMLFTLFFNDVAILLGVGCRLIYADDLKIYLAVRSVEDCRRLQILIDLFVNWCHKNRFIISLAKCVVMTFHRKQSPIVFDYQIDGAVLKRVDHVVDLGVILDSKLNFNMHRSVAISKANRQLGFIAKVAKDFTDPYCWKALYCALVRPLLETASLVWFPYQLSWSLRIERVQRRFLRLALKDLPWRDSVNLPPYLDRCRLLSLDSLEYRRNIQQALFVVKLLNGEVDSPNLLGMIQFRAPQRTLRPSSMLQTGHHRTSFGFNEPMTACIRTFNVVDNLFDFGMSSYQFRKILTRYMCFRS